MTTATGMLDKSKPLMIWAGNLTREFLLKELDNTGIAHIGKNVIDEAVNQHNVRREAAATSGSLVHEWAENYIAGRKPEVPTDPAVKNGVLAFLKWVNEKGVRFIASEKMVYSKKYDYVGTLDCIFTLKAEGHQIIHLGDFKTSKSFYIDHFFQTAGYEHAYFEEYGTNFGSKFILKFDKETGEFEPKEIPAKEHAIYFDGFLACLKLKQLSKMYEKVHGYYAQK